ncbi:hypothetical protein EIP86_003267 [Pleurotus ostreatoroseus]|nr:hypothetical protein EIP86_003267 [Pleurotus ostreatoroseus]
MAILSVQLGMLLVTLWVLFKILRSFTKKNPLQNVAGPVPYSRVSGDMEILFDRHKGWGYKAEIAEKYGGVVHLHGMFGSDVLYVFDPLALQQVLTKDGVYYEQPSFAYSANLVMFGPGILSVRGARILLQRAIRSTIDSGESDEIDIMHWVSRTAMELIGQGGMGHSFDNLSPGVQIPNALGEAMKSLS